VDWKRREQLSQHHTETHIIYTAGADMIILGNGCEQNPELLLKACSIRDRFRKKQFPIA
jgi:5'-3' exonuclease